MSTASRIFWLALILASPVRAAAVEPVKVFFFGAGAYGPAFKPALEQNLSRQFGRSFFVGVAPTEHLASEQLRALPGQIERVKPKILFLVVNARLDVFKNYLEMNRAPPREASSYFQLIRNIRDTWRLHGLPEKERADLVGEKIAAQIGAMRKIASDSGAKLFVLWVCGSVKNRVDGGFLKHLDSVYRRLTPEVDVENEKILSYLYAHGTENLIPIMVGQGYTASGAKLPEEESAHLFADSIAIQAGAWIGPAL